MGGRARLTTFVAIEATSSALLDYSHFCALPEQEFAGTSVSLMEKSAKCLPLKARQFLWIGNKITPGVAERSVRSQRRNSLHFVSDDDSWDLVTCFCMKPFAGRPMIECNECHTWIHLSCAKIRKSNVPEVYICQKCRDSKFDIRRSNRSRTGSRRRFLD